MDVKQAEATNGPEEIRQAWVAPTFERLPLSEAMAGPLTAPSDGGTTYIT
jgi:hypothetical protein